MNPTRWITTNSATPSTPGSKFQSIHTCLIPSGPHRGEVLVLDGNLTNYGVRAYQPWAIVNPYYPNPNPFVAGGGSGFRFHNAALLMPTGQGELFCGGQRWTADGRLFFAGGTKAYPPISAGSSVPAGNTGVLGTFIGARLVYQWDPVPAPPAHPFGQWFKMAQDLDVDRWYPTVVSEGTTADRMLVLAGSDFAAGATPGSGSQEIWNDYESYRINFALAPTPGIIAHEQKLGVTGPSSYRYQGPPLIVYPVVGPLGFTEYPRAHALGFLDPISGAAHAPRLFVSGMAGGGIRWAHDPAVNPTYFADLGQELTQSYLQYSTNLLFPSGINAIPSLVVRIGGFRVTGTGLQFSNLVESATVEAPPTSWSSGTSNDFANMAHARYLANVVILPTGELLAIGGTDGAGFVLEPEVLGPSGRWRAMASHVSPRDYHSCAVLLPDARVFVGGGEGRTADYEIFAPEYLQVPANHRPSQVQVVDEATLAPVSSITLGALSYGGAIRAFWNNQLARGVEVDRAVLMAPAALTHHDDGGQRLVRLHTSQGPANALFPFGSVVIKAPAGEEYAPPGWYMLFLLTNEGVPANAVWVNLR